MGLQVNTVKCGHRMSCRKGSIRLRERMLSLGLTHMCVLTASDSPLKCSPDPGFIRLELKEPLGAQ